MQGNPWAPEIHHGKSGYVAVFGGLNGGRNVIGVATAPAITGPWTDKGSPIVARATSAIDAHILRDGDDMYLYFKRELEDTKDADKDGNKAEGRDAIYVTRLAADGKSVTSGTAAATTANDTYALGVARSKSPTGPFVKYRKPIVSSGKRFAGPGHNTVVNARGKNVLVFHAYDKKEGVPSCEKGSPKDNNQRGVLSFALEYKNGWPRAKGMKL